MSTEFIVTIVVIIACFIVSFLYLRQKDKKKEAEKQDNKSLLLLQNQLNELNRTLDSKLGDSTRVIQQQFAQSTKIIQGISGQSQKVISEVAEKLTKLDDTNKQVVGFTEQLQSLQEIFKNPMQRGVVGEYFLETLLKNTMPPGTYRMQYNLGKDENTEKYLIVDAVVFIKDKKVPIDSKFSLENYNRLMEEKNELERNHLEKIFINDLKNRIVETAKYIRQDKGTMDFAFMFIPHEAIYYDLLVNKIGAIKGDTESLIQRAASRYHVIIVSPTSFLAYLQTVLQGLHALKIEESAKDIRKRVEMLGRHINAYEEYFKKLGNHLGTTVNTYNTAYKELGKIDKDVMKISEGAEGGGVEPIQLDRPSGDN